MGGINVGPTFDNPLTAGEDNALVPRLVSWISKNPHPPGADNVPGEDFKKTLIWSVPPKAFVGKITVSASGDTTFEGTFWTPRSPGGKDGADLDDTEKDNLLALLHAEIDRVDEFERELRTAGPAYFKNANVMSSLVPIDVRVSLPAHPAAGKASVFTAAAFRMWGKPVPNARYDWRFSDGSTFTGRRIRKPFKEAGSYRVRLTVSDRFGGRAVVERTVTVRGGG